MQAKQVLGISAVVLMSLFVVGCGAVWGDQAKHSAEELSTVPAQVTGVIFDEGVADDNAICVAFGDVLTVIWNADAGLDQGRMTAQEHWG